MRKNLLLLLTTLIFSAVSIANAANDMTGVKNIKADSGEISISSSGIYKVTYRGQVVTYNNVRTFVMFNNNPYLGLKDGRIIKWHTLISKDAINLQVVWDKLYFVKQYSDGGLYGVSLFIIDKLENVREIKLSSKGVPVVTEDFGVFGDRFIIQDVGNKGFCVVDKNGNVGKCYPW